jgi:peptide/nickel transport system permease protein
MLAKSFQYATKTPWLVVSPGVMIFLTVFSIFLIADGIRDALDPRISQAKQELRTQSGDGSLAVASH